MKRMIAMSLLLLAAVSAFAHAGHAHTYMGTVTMLHKDGSFMMKTTTGKEITIVTTATTTYAHADGHAAKRSDLAAGMRVVVKMAADGKSAANVKMSEAAK